jgi:hypothetical protein
MGHFPVSISRLNRAIDILFSFLLSIEIVIVHDNTAESYNKIRNYHSNQF